VEILHVDDHVIALDKPAGLPVLPDGWQPESEYVLKRLEREHGRVWLVHRLDKATSGVMILARSAAAHRNLSLQFEGRSAGKIYHALCLGNPSWEEKIARHPLRVNVGHKHRTMVDDREGKPSETRFRVLRRFREYALLEAVLVTGRTHQIRVHACALGHPLVGDELYGASPTDLIARPALHSYSLTIDHPATGQRVTFTAAYPPDLEEALERV
jgi:RluA family pseudouridine synthase